MCFKYDNPIVHHSKAMGKVKCLDKQTGKTIPPLQSLVVAQNITQNFNPRNLETFEFRYD